MWFDDEELSGRRLFIAMRNRRRRPILRVNAKLSAQRRMRSRRIAVFVLVPTVIACAGLVGWLSLKLATDLLFSGNERYTIQRLDIRVRKGAVITSDLVREYTGLSEGKNLFGFNIGKIRRRFLELAPNVKAVEISRHLPSTMVVEITERVPLARIRVQWGRHLAVDEEGKVFGGGVRAARLPTITGYNGARLKPGSRITGMALAAIELVEASRDWRLDFDIESVYVGNTEYLVVDFRDGRRSRVAWVGMEEMTQASRKNLLKQLSMLARTLKSRQGRHHAMLDVTYEDKIYGQ